MRAEPPSPTDDHGPLGQEQAVGILEDRAVGERDLDVDRRRELRARPGCASARRPLAATSAMPTRRRPAPAPLAARRDPGDGPRRRGRSGDGRGGRADGEQPRLEPSANAGSAPGGRRPASSSRRRMSSLTTGPPPSSSRRRARVARWTTTAIVALEVPRAAAASSGGEPGEVAQRQRLLVAGAQAVHRGQELGDGVAVADLVGRVAGPWRGSRPTAAVERSEAARPGRR